MSFRPTLRLPTEGGKAFSVVSSNCFFRVAELVRVQSSRRLAVLAATIFSYGRNRGHYRFFGSRRLAGRRHLDRKTFPTRSGALSLEGSLSPVPYAYERAISLSLRGAAGFRPRPATRRHRAIGQLPAGPRGVRRGDLAGAQLFSSAPITRLPQTPDYLCGLINLRNTVIPVIDLRRRFGLSQQPPTDDTRIVVVHLRGKTVGLVVDAVCEVFRVPRERIVPPPPAWPASMRFPQGAGAVGRPAWLSCSTWTCSWTATHEHAWVFRWSDASLEAFAQLIYVRSGIRVVAEAVLLSNRALRRRLQATGDADFEAYYRRLQALAAGDVEWDHLLQEVSTHETYCSANAGQWRWLQESFLPQALAEAARGDRPRRLRFWSAACSTGDEAYTIAACAVSRKPSRAGALKS